MEQSPFADADETLFEEEEYGLVSALLGERAKPFLGIPTGPLQVGHFVGALGIVLMAFIEYPGFPLTNLPTPIRDALQGGTKHMGHSIMHCCLSLSVCVCLCVFICCSSLRLRCFVEKPQTMHYYFRSKISSVDVMSS